MDKDKIIALLNQDLEGEHAAIIQYLLHAYAELRVVLRENPCGFSENIGSLTCSQN